MKKTIQIFVKKTYPGLGPINSTKYVTLGYAFNYLIPKQIAGIATKKQLKHIQILNDSRDRKKNLTYLNNITVKTRLEEITKINIRKKASIDKQIFGRITENEIIEAIRLLTNELISKKQIKIPNIKNIGVYVINIYISNKIKTSLVLHILPTII